MKTILLTVLLTLSASFSHAAAATEEKVKVQVTENGFEPSEIKVKAGSHVILQVTRTTDATCATAIQVKEKKIKKDLPLNKEVSVDLGTVKKGDVTFACGMDMISAHVIAE
jgi:plastocyanin domain-containing protein